MKGTPGAGSMNRFWNFALGKSPKEIRSHRNPKIGLIELENRIPERSGAFGVYALTNTHIAHTNTASLLSPAECFLSH